MAGCILLAWQLLVSLSFAAYAVQLGAFKTKKKALIQQENLAQQSIPSVVKHVGKWYKVFHGPYSSREEAKKAVVAFRAKGFPGIVREVPDQWFPKMQDQSKEHENSSHDTEKKSKDNPGPKENGNSLTAEQEAKLSKLSGLFKLATFESQASARGLFELVRKNSLTALILVKKVKEKTYYVVAAQGEGKKVVALAKKLGVVPAFLYGE